MHKRTKASIRLALAALLALAATGCVSEAELRSRRIYSDIETFSRLDPDAQARIQEGRIQIGDGTAAAWMAYGEPGAKSVQATTNGTYEVWNYFRSVPEYYDELVPPDPPPRHHHHPPRMAGAEPPPPPPPERGWHYEERVRYVDVLKRQLLFGNGLCIGIFEY